MSKNEKSKESEIKKKQKKEAERIRREEERIAKVERKRKQKEIEKKLSKEILEVALLYKDFFPKARKLNRNITFYAGPTNSGKTWSALNNLINAEDGAYLCPLRLLAIEGKEEIEKRGHKCSFITGEEREIDPEARFTAQTIETFDYNKRYGAVLIDEIQMISDRQRGWAWCQALYGAYADEIILTGSPDIIPIVEAIVKELGDNLQVVELERKTTLKYDYKNFSLKNTEPNTAIVCFSRKRIFELKHLLEKEKKTVSVVYGNLSPEVRREEARRFREGQSEVLVCTDAISMGLNLPIKRIVFDSFVKFNGDTMIDLPKSEFLQIAGRAGRYGLFDEGVVCGFDSLGHYLRENKWEKQEITAYLGPNQDIIEKMAEILNTQSIKRIIEKFSSLGDVGILETPKLSYEILNLCSFLDKTKLSLLEKFEFSKIPLEFNNQYSSIIREWISNYVERKESKVREFFPVSYKLHSNNNLLSAEINVKALSGYSWLNQKFIGFPDYEECFKLRHKIDALIREIIIKKAEAPKCKKCSGKLSEDEWIYGQCNRCYMASRYYYDFNEDNE